MRRLFAILSLVFLVSSGAVSMSRDSLDRVLFMPQRFAPVPRSGDAFWRDSLPPAMRRSYIAAGERYLGQPWASLPATLFGEYKANGNRSRYEAACFAKRRQLAMLAMAEIAEGHGRFVNDIVDGLLSHCEETWWGIPAHYGKNIPVPADQTVDLFNAETAGLVAWIRYALADRLDSVVPQLTRRIDDEIGRRVLTPALRNNYWWKKAGMNWNPWICSNWLACILICEPDRSRQLDGVGQVMAAMEAFTKAYPDDGGCDEGTGYWDRAAASLFECHRMLGMATGGRSSKLTDKERRMMQFIYKMYIGNGFCVNFADAHDNRMQAQPDIIVPMSLWLGDTVMQGLAARIAEDGRLFDAPAALYQHSGNFPAFGRELFMLRDISAARALTPRDPQQTDVWLGDLQIMTARRGGLYVAVKGGTNGESHNHNDVGSFIVYADGRPLVIDPGVGEYTSATFSKDRYSIWTMQSAYHNLPLINGVMQRDGKRYAAKMVAQKKGSLTLDIAGAYPAEAAVELWRRTVTARSRAIEVTEDYRLAEHKAPTQLMLLTVARPDTSVPGRIAIDGHTVSYDKELLDAAVEDISGRMDGVLRRIWGDSLYRIVLTVRGENKAGKISYQIR